MELKDLPVFRGLTPRQMQTLCARAISTRTFEKGARVFCAGDIPQSIGLVLTGCVHIESSDLWGGRSILGSVGAGGAFAEAYAVCAAPMPVDAVCAARSTIAFLRVSEALHAQMDVLTQNLMQLAMQKNRALSERIFCTTPKTIRGRLLTYLSAQAVGSDMRTVMIPFDRQQLADYLNVERTALSKELGRMRRDGLLQWHKNRFTLMTDETPVRTEPVHTGAYDDAVQS